MEKLPRVIVFDTARELKNAQQVHSDVSAACDKLGVPQPMHTFNEDSIVYEFKQVGDKKKVYKVLKSKYQA